MVQFAKRLGILVIVVSASGAGMISGFQLTRWGQVVSAAHAASAMSGASLAAAGGENKSTGQQADRYENLELFNRVLHFVENNYVDEVKNKDLIHGAIKGMLETLDPHSNFLPPDVFKDMKIDTSGKFGGLGIEIGMKDNLLTVISPIEDTPAWKAGLKPNDRIVKIDKESTKGMSLVEAVSKMRGKPRTDVILSVYREGFDKIREIKITREIIKIQSVKSEPVEPEYGYVRLSSFNESAAADVKKAIDNLNKKKKLRGLVFDMRMNPGGLLDQAVEVASLFYEDGVVVSTIGRNRDQKEVKHAHKNAAFKELPVAILVNSSTASAAEIVAGALQDHHRAIVMGQPTFGKGSVQTVIELPHDMGLKLTIARYYTPSGRSIQEKGVQPDIILDEFDPKLLAKARLKTEAFRERDLKGHMANTDKKAEEDEAKEFKQEELEAITRESKGKGDKADKKEDDDLTPIRFNPKEDFQVREAVNYLKSYELFKKISMGGGTAASTAKQ